MIFVHPPRALALALIALVVGIFSPPAIDAAAPASPKVQLSCNGHLIGNGTMYPNIADGTDFGQLSLGGAQLTHTFTITNTGTATLNLLGYQLLPGNPLVWFMGPNPEAFKVTTLPQSSIAPGSSTNFTVTYDPSQPGEHLAFITLRSNTYPDIYSCEIKGFGTEVALLPQNIDFPIPSVVYIPTQNPLYLPAMASSGLPVSFEVLSGPANYDEGAQVLNLTDVGTVKVRATQAGSGGGVGPPWQYAAAPPVTVTFTVKDDPTTLTLINLNQTFDGQPKPVDTLGAKGEVTLTYMVGGKYVSTPPTNAGRYGVKAVDSAGAKTGTLVIAKALVYVKPLNRRKFAGQVNPELECTYSNYPYFLSPLLKEAVARTTATKASPPGRYPITASGAVADNTTFIYQPGVLVVEGFGGTYEALLKDALNVPAGKISLRFNSAATAFTGKLYVATETTALSLTGTVTQNLITEVASGSGTVTKGGHTYGVSFTLPVAGPMQISVTQNSVPLATANDGQKLLVLPAGQKVPYAGNYTATLIPDTTTGSAIPPGAGWAAVSIGNTGVATLTGMLGDGVKFTTTLSPDGNTDPGYRIFVQPYLAARTEAFLAGTFSLIPYPPSASGRYLDGAELIWKKSGLPADTSYREGFGPVATYFTMHPWTKPATRQTMASVLGLPGTLFFIFQTATGLSADADLPTDLNISGANAISVLSPAANLTKWKTTLATATGVLSGSFEVMDGMKKRSVPFSGVLRQDPTHFSPTDQTLGGGLFILPALSGAPTTESHTGEIIFQRPWDE